MCVCVCVCVYVCVYVCVFVCDIRYAVYTELSVDALYPVEGTMNNTT